MASTSFRCKIVLLLLLAVLAAPWASAAGRLTTIPWPAVASAPTPFDVLSSAWRFLTRLWSEEGCRIDPSGACVPGSAQPLPAPRTGEGCRIDPNGACTPPARVDTGCRIDPNGLCRF